MKLTGRDGTLKIFDSAAVLHGAAPRDDATPDIVKWDGASSYTNITSDVDTDDASAASAFIADNNDAVFVGSDVIFAMINYVKGAGTNYASGSGALIAYYFDGTDFSNELSGVTDGTASGGDCFGQDGKITFKIPKDWSTGANTIDSSLDSDKYYVKLMMTTSSSTDPDADVLCPCDGQFFEVSFSAMDFSGPIGRALTEELLILNRNRVDSKAHYIENVDNKIYEAVPLSFSCTIDDTHNKDDILIVLECGNPSSANWTSTGTSTKGDTKNDGTNSNPSFADSNKKTVNIQIIFDAGRTGGIPIGIAYYEVYFPPDEQNISESEDGATLSCSGGVFGLIERIHGFGNRY